MVNSFFSTPAMAIANSDRHFPMNNHRDMWGGGYSGMFIMMLIVLVLIVVVIYAVTRATQGKGDSDSLRDTRETPLEILKRRYAKGEITKDQFEQMKKDL